MLDIFRPKFTVERLETLECGMLQDAGIQAVMLDLDNTLAPYRSTEVPWEIQAWIAGLQASGLRACMVTNASTPIRIAPVADALGIPWVKQANKPLAGGFQRGMNLLDSTPQTTAMVGDMLLTDIYGGNRLGLFTVLVKPLTGNDAWLAKYIQRPLEGLIGRRIIVAQSNEFCAAEQAVSSEAAPWIHGR
jgi:HAD superfamily phosphatase (TIGR01668 family)